MKFGTVALVGRSNVGKSTLLNTILEQPLAIMSPLPQTTRDNLLGVVTRDDWQMAFVDTPGLHRPRTELGRRMNTAALEAARATDVLVFMTDVSDLVKARKKVTKETALSEDDKKLIRSLPAGVPSVAVVNKVDLLRNKTLLLPMLEALVESRPFSACVPLSARKGDGTEPLLTEIAALLPERAAAYAEDALTDKPTSFFAREYIREQVLLATKGEVPHAVAVSIDRFEEKKGLTVIKATIHVEKAGQRMIVVGKGADKLEQIGIGARQRIEELLGHKVHLELFVRVTPRWKDVPRQLAELGYEGHPGGAPGAEEKRQ